jgi:hypothetical protein
VRGRGVRRARGGVGDVLDQPTHDDGATHDVHGAPHDHHDHDIHDDDIHDDDHDGPSHDRAADDCCSRPRTAGTATPTGTERQLPSVVRAVRADRQRRRLRRR